MCTACAAHAPGPHRTPLHLQDQHFALFSFVNELNGECEKLEGEISGLRSEIEKFKGQGISTYPTAPIRQPAKEASQGALDG